jgi:hypothetical protein
MALTLTVLFWGAVAYFVVKAMQQRSNALRADIARLQQELGHVKHWARQQGYRDPAPVQEPQDHP